MAIAVEGAGVAKRVEVFFIDDVADWGPFAEFLLIGHGAIVVDLYLFVQHDIGGEDGPGGRFAVVDELGKFQQIVSGSDLVRITLLAAALQPSALAIR